jgi:hypothetical protein
MSQLEVGKLDKVRLCPRCMSALVETTTSTLVDLPGTDTVNEAKCRTCGWAGKAGELLALPFGNPFGNGEAAVEAFSRDVLMAIAKECAMPIGRVLVRWGFIPDRNIDKRQFSAYMAAVSKAVALSIVTERERQERMQLYNYGSGEGAGGKVQ